MSVRIALLCRSPGKVSSLSPFASVELAEADLLIVSFFLKICFCTIPSMRVELFATSLCGNNRFRVWPNLVSPMASFLVSGVSVV